MARLTPPPSLAEAILLPPFPGTTPPAWLLRALQRGLAGVTLFGSNVAHRGQLAALTAALRSAAPTEPVIAIDEEGGDVTRLAHLTGSPYPGNAALGAVDDVALTMAVYRAMGHDVAGAGVNLDLAPCVDVNAVAANPVIGTRSFGAGTGLVARHAAAAVTGLQSAGVAACAKHFPGHGSTHDDSHRMLATVAGGLRRLRERDLPPFAAAISAGVAAVMPGHLRVPGLTGDLPATLSAAALGGLLRGQLGFTGVIISDALEMRGVSGGLGITEAAVQAVAAGADLLCLGRDVTEEDYLAVAGAITAAVESGRLPAARLADAAERTARLRLMLARGTFPGAVRPAAAAPREEAAGRDRAGAAAAADADLAGAGTAGMDPAQAGTAGMDPAQAGAAGLGRAGAAAAADADLAGAGTAGVDPAQTAAVGAVVADATGTGPARADGSLGEAIGLVAARRALRMTGQPGVLASPLVIEITPAGNIAAGSVPWGLSPWLPEGSVVRVPSRAGAGGVDQVRRALRGAQARSVIAVVRDAHRDPGARALVTALLAERPDAVLVEMGLPVWQPPARAYLASYGASRASGQAAAEALGLTAPPPTPPLP